MPKLKLVVENTFIESEATSNELGITVFERVFNKFTKERAALGKVQPLYIEVNGMYKVFGVLTLNKNGSYSFFPEFPSGLPFDHVTFVKNLSKGGHHYTRLTDSGREKILPLFAEPLTNGMRHALSFTLDFALLKDTPKKVYYPEIDEENVSEIIEAFFTAGTQEGSTLIKLGSGQGTVCIQFFLIPKETDYKNMVIYPEGIKKIQKDFEVEEGKQINIFNVVAPHKYQTDYVLGVINFLYDKKMDEPLMIIGQASKDGFYSKIEIKQIER